MGLFRCWVCSEPPAALYEFQADRPECPKCGAGAAPGMPLVVAVETVHLMVLGSGPIRSAFGRQHVACQPKREHLNLHPHEGFYATDDPRAVTCPSCKGTPAYQGLARLIPELRRGPDGKVGDCCG